MGATLSKAIIFDFDGTLVDSEKTIRKCFQNITYELAPERIKFAKNILIGPPLRDTASEILGPRNQNQLDQFVRQFIQMHDDQVILHTQPYIGVHNLLKKLALMNIPMAIATNKRKAPTIKLIEHFEWASYFYTIQCSDTRLPTRNKDNMLKDIINTDNIFMNSFFVGDTVNDGLSANAHKLKFIRANYGYGQTQDWSKIDVVKSIESFSELEIILN